MHHRTKTQVQQPSSTNTEPKSSTEQRWQDQIGTYLGRIKDSERVQKTGLDPILLSLRTYVVTQMRDLRASEVVRFNTVLSSAIANQIHSANTFDRIAGCLAIQQLVDVDYAAH